MGRRSAVLAVLLTAVVSLSGSRPAEAAPLQCGDTVTGSVVLRRNLTGCPLSGLVVGANNTTINLNGFVIAGNGADDNNALIEAGIDNSGGFDNVIVQGSPTGAGVIRGFEIGVEFGNTTVVSSTGSIVRRLAARSNGIGVFVRGSGNQVFRVRALANATFGIQIDPSGGNTIKNNRAQNNGFDGILIDSSNNNQVLNNVVVHNGFDPGAGNNDEGIHLIDASNNTVKGNTSNANDEDGIDLEGSDSNTIEANTLQSNEESGIDFDTSDDNTISRNVIVGNQDDGIDLLDSASNTFSNNRMLENDSDGIDQFGGDANTYEGNIASRNGSDGMDISDDAVPITVTLTDNTANRNADFGIVLGGAVTPVASGNTAANNGETDQCSPPTICNV
jgi:large repetitive protein